MLRFEVGRFENMHVFSAESCAWELGRSEKKNVCVQRSKCQCEALATAFLGEIQKNASVQRRKLRIGGKVDSKNVCIQRCKLRFEGGVEILKNAGVQR